MKKKRIRKRMKRTDSLKIKIPANSEYASAVNKLKLKTVAFDRRSIKGTNEYMKNKLSP